MNVNTFQSMATCCEQHSVLRPQELSVLIVSVRGMCIRQWWSKTCWWQDCTRVFYLPKTDVYLKVLREEQRLCLLWSG